MKQLLSAILLLSFAATLPVRGQEATPLEQDKPVERELAAGDKHTFEIVLSANEFVYGEADQQTVDVVVTVYNPDGHLLETFDSPARGPEPFQFKSEREGTYRIEVAPFKEETGRYIMRLLRMEPVATTLEEQVDQLMATYDRPGTPGCAVGLYRNDALAHAKGYGMADLEQGTPITSRTVFDIGSTSKQFTAASLVLLQNQGKLSLSDDVRTFIPELPDYGNVITIRHLLNHTSGLRDYIRLMLMMGTDIDDVTTDEEALRAITLQRALNFQPGEEHLYSNSGYFLASLIVERVSGQTLRTFARKHIFEPLGMNHTTYIDDHTAIVPHRAIGYDNSPRGGYRRDVSYWEQNGDGAVFTTVEDLLKWDQNFYNPRIGGANLNEALLQRGILNSGDTLDYALGLRHGEHREVKTVRHGGSWGGYRAELMRVPSEHVSVAVLCNLGSTIPTQLARRVLEVVLADQLAEAEERVPSADDREMVEIDPGLFDDYVGEYELQPGFSLTFTREENRFFGQDTGQSRFEIFPSSDSTFFPTAFEATLTFHRDPDGTVSRLTLHQGGDHVARRPYTLTVEELSAYAGRYYSPELETTYTLDIEDGKLVARHAKLDSTTLTPRAKDSFSGDQWYMRGVAFERGDDHVDAMVVSAGQIKNLRFERQE